MRSNPKLLDHKTNNCTRLNDASWKVQAMETLIANDGRIAGFQERNVQVGSNHSTESGLVPVICEQLGALPIEHREVVSGEVGFKTIAAWIRSFDL